MPNQVSPRTKVRLFTDDCMVCCEVKSHQLQDQVTLQRDLHALQLWAERWGMRFNPQKCDIMHIAHQLQAHRVQMYELCGVTLDSVTQAKYLGAIISADLQWHSQVCAVAKKAHTTLYFIYRTLKYCPRSSRATAYTSVVRSGMEHCAGIWDTPPPPSNRTKTPWRRSIDELSCVLQQDLARSQHQPHLPVAIPWRESLEARRYNQRMVLMYNITHDLIAVPPTHLISPSHTTRGHSLKSTTIRSEILFLHTQYLRVESSKQ